MKSVLKPHRLITPSPQNTQRICIPVYRNEIKASTYKIKKDTVTIKDERYSRKRHFMDERKKFMKHALLRAKTAARHGETPVGAVIVKDGKIISGGRNRREQAKNALCHAEISAINSACRKLGGWRLRGCDLYVTLEPCPMCAGAIINARIENVYFGAYDSKAGSFGSVINFNDLGYNHKPGITGGIMEKECSQILSDFFKELRHNKKVRNKG